MSPAPRTMSGNGTLKKKIATKAAAASADHHPVLERPLADAHHRLEHDGEHRRLEPEEQRRDDADLAPGGVDQAQGHDGDEARQDEQRAGDEPALRLVQQPADIGGELLRLGAGQQHAVVERVQEPVLADPALLLDEDAVHDGDLPGRAAEGQRGDRAPRPARPRRRGCRARARRSLAVARRSRPPPESRRSCRRSALPRASRASPASYGSRRWRRGTSGRRRRRAPCRPRAARGRRRTCATGRARRRAAPPLPARGRAGPCRRRARSWRGASSGSVARPNSSTMASKVQRSPRWLQNTPSPRCRRASRRSARRRPSPRTARRTGTRRSDRRSGGSARGRRCGRSSAASASPRRCGPWRRAAAACRPAPSAGRPAAQPSAPPSSESAGTPACRSQAATPWLSFSPFWQMTTAERPANSGAHSATSRCERRTAPGMRRGSQAKSSSVRTSMRAGQSGRPIRRASLSGEMVLGDDMACVLRCESRTRCFGMSPRGEIAVPMAGDLEGAARGLSSGRPARSRALIASAAADADRLSCAPPSPCRARRAARWRASADRRCPRNA